MGFCASGAGQSNFSIIASPGCGSGLDVQLWALVLHILEFVSLLAMQDEALGLQALFPLCFQ